MPPPKSFVSRIKTFDIYRKVPKDLTEPSVIGGSCSLFAIIILSVLFLLELWNYFTPEYVTSIEVDHAEDGILQININLTLTGLSCEFAALELYNSLGDKKQFMNVRTLHKYSLDGKYSGFAAENIHSKATHYYEGTDTDHYGNHRYAIELTADTFNEVISDHEVILVDFHAPWCSHCQKMAPIFEHAAHIVQEKAVHGLDSHMKHSVNLGTFDCTIPAHIQICRDNHIQAYPTVLVFRKGKNEVVAKTASHPVHESYHGIRTADSISKFALKVFDEVKNGDPELKYPATGRGTNSEGDGKPESTVRTLGCRIEGFIMAQRVPTKILIKPQSEHHNFNTSLLTLDHKIDHLSFGNRKPSPVKRLIQENMEGAYSEKPGKAQIMAEGEEVVGFVSPKGLWTHEHYLKVVSFTHVPSRGRREHSYEYTVNSNMHYPDDGVPEIVFSFDLSPLKIFIREKSKRFTEEIIKIFALIGGLFSCSIIFESLVASAIYTVVKKLD